MTDHAARQSLLGPAFPALGWVPAPRYVLRRARILRLLENSSPGSVLEIGPGAGALLSELSARGFACQALELSAPARDLATRVLATTSRHTPVHAEPDPSWVGKFDYVFAFDVLEHVEHDRQALAQWVSWLKPGGTLLLSVPARMKLWTAGDQWAGHFRRYERAGLQAMLESAALRIDTFECYGFPLSNLTEKVSARAYRAHTIASATPSEAARRQNNDRSGIDRRPHLRLFPFLQSIPGRLCMQAACWVQSLFLRFDLGSGYIAKAHRPTAPADPRDAL